MFLLSTPLPSASRCISFVKLLLITCAAILSVNLKPALAQNSPDTPAITEPARDGQLVNPADVHMETGPFSDPDAGDTHACTDWEILTGSSGELIWEARCLIGVERLHAHFGDGDFRGSHAGRAELFYDTGYVLRARHRDQAGLWSALGERIFRTGSPTQIFAFELADVADSPVPQLLDETESEMILPTGNPAAALRLVNANGDLFLAINGQNSLGNEIVNPPAFASHQAVAVVIDAGSGALALPSTHLNFTDGDGIDRTFYFPSLALSAFERIYFWIAIDGSSFFGEATQSGPDFSRLAQGAPVPWRALQPGYQVEIVTQGLQLPVNIAFKPNAGTQPNDPFFYVTELYGTIKVITRDGTVSDYATGLLNFNPTGDFPGSGEQGLSGIVVDPVTGDVFISVLYEAGPPPSPHYPKVVRLHSNDGGMTAATQTTILDMPGEEQGQSHFISNLSFGPDGRLYIHMGDGFDAATARNLNSFRGKILRAHLDGMPPSDNPFYDARDDITARDYVFAYGFRNPFGGAWRAADGGLYEVENGPESNDRLAKVERGFDYGWNGSGNSLTTRAIYNWNPPHAPVNIAFIEAQTFGGSGFPAEKMDRAFVTESGSTWASGPQSNGKRIVEFELDANSVLLSGPTKLVEYTGSGKATAVGLAAGPDGLYFTDLYKDQDYDSPIDRGAHVLRVKFVGEANFSVDVDLGPAPLTAQFTDLSNVPAPVSWRWNFGDGDSSHARHPIHTYTRDGVYTVRLVVTGANGIAVAQKNNLIAVGEVLRSGVRGEYFDDLEFTGTKLTRIDSTIDFDWMGGSPDPSMDADFFSIRWTGYVQPLYSESYTFIVLVDDGVRLWIDDQLVIDQWIDQAPTEHRGAINLLGGKYYRLKMEFYERGGGAVARLGWSSASQTEQSISAARLFHTRFPGDPQHVNAPAGSPARFALAQNYPNPFNAGTTIRFEIPGAGEVTAILRNVRGEVIAELLRGSLRAGPHRIVWSGKDGQQREVASGVYFLQLTHIDRQKQKTMCAIKMAYVR